MIEGHFHISRVERAAPAVTFDAVVKLAVAGVGLHTEVQILFNRRKIQCRLRGSAIVIVIIIIIIITIIIIIIIVIIIILISITIIKIRIILIILK